jgi:DNA-binding MarR family transcriptional regulator
MVEAIESLIDEVRLLYHRAVQVSEELHREEPVTVGMRAVLEFLQGQGPTPVPRIARSRFVSRQHIQSLVNALLERGLVETRRNPAHKRSSLVVLTKAGKQLIRRMREREADRLRQTKFGPTRSEIQRATRTLRDVRSALGGSS